VISRVVLLLIALAVLAVLLYMQRGGIGGGTESTVAQSSAPEPGMVAIGAQIIETGSDGKPLYTLNATRITQPMPDGTIYVTSPVLHYTPSAGNPWVLTAKQGQLPQSAQTADLSGSVHAEGKPQGSSQLLDFDTSVLHVDMQQQLATTTAVVHVQQAGNRLTARGMRANLKSGEIELYHDVSGVMVH
jgi:LPS export ABC transporter protein LptC